MISIQITAHGIQMSGHAQCTWMTRQKWCIVQLNTDMDKREQWLLELADEAGGVKSLALKRLAKKVRTK